MIQLCPITSDLVCQGHVEKSGFNLHGPHAVSSTTFPMDVNIEYLVHEKSVTTACLEQTISSKLISMYNIIIQIIINSYSSLI